MSYSAGLLDQVVTLQQRAAGTGGRGQDNGAWQTVADVWARVEPMRGREYQAAAQLQAEMDTRITIRYRADVTELWRVLWRGVPYDIVSPPIDPGARAETLELMCTTGVRDGR